MAAKATRPRARSKRCQPPAARPHTDADHFFLRLYVAGQTRKSLQAIANLQQICQDNLQGRYRIEVVDLLVRPELARADQILAIPTLVRRLPEPIKKIIGDLSQSERVLLGLDVLPVAKADEAKGGHG